MNTDLLISVLVLSNWLFLAGWILVLAAAFILSFPEKLLPAPSQERTWQNPGIEE
jgi:hypothetical protein